MSYIKTGWQNTPSTQTPLSAENLNHIEQGIYDAQEKAEAVEAMLGALQAREEAATAADMTDTSKIYIYTGSEAGYTFGDWYYYNGSAWVSGGAYNSTAVNTDTTLSVQGAPADAKTTGDRIGKIEGIASGADLNNLTTRGFYQLAFAGTFINSPLDNDVNIHKALEVLVRGTFIVQRFSAYKHSSPIDYQEFLRIFDGSVWRNWQRGIGATDFSTLVANTFINGNYATGTDLNTISTRGFYRLAYGGTFVNSPVSAEEETNKWKFIEVLKDDTQYYQRYTIYAHGAKTCAQYIRIYDGTAWKAWAKCFDSTEIATAYKFATNKNTPNESFTAASIGSQGGNNGLNLRVATYNVANYNNDTATYISDSKLLNLRKVINEIDADILFTQEDREYIDSGNTKSNKFYIYFPKYPYLAGMGGNTIKCKVQGSNDYVLRLSGQRSMRAYLLTFGDIKLLVVSTHPTANYNSTGITSPESIAERQTEYQEIFGWCNGDISLNKTDGSGAVYAPTHTHCIIGADANSLADDDKTNLATLAASNNFILGNGGFLGWFITNPKGNYAIDNIMVSENVVINRIESLNSKYDDLYSDHVPVVADLTLL